VPCGLGAHDPRYRPPRPQELEAAFGWLDEHFYVIHSADDAMPTLDWVLEKARAAVVK
jgi:hypothetical protein